MAIIKAYKAFNKDLRCRDFQYKIGETYTEPEAILCEKGFHACEAPIEILQYYSCPGARYCEVELDATDEVESGSTKRVGKTITIIKELSYEDLANAQMKYLASKKKVTPTSKEISSGGIIETVSAGCQELADIDDYSVEGVTAAGDNGGAQVQYGVTATYNNGVSRSIAHGIAVTGSNGIAMCYDGIVAAGNRSVAKTTIGRVAVAGEFGHAISGLGGTSAVSYSGIAESGVRGISVANVNGVAETGNYGMAVSRYKAVTGACGIAIAKGQIPFVKGGLGATLVLIRDNVLYNYRAEIITGVVDGVNLKVNTWYTCKDGQFKEVEDEDE